MGAIPYVMCYDRYRRGPGRLHEEVKGEGYWELVRAGEGKVGGWRGKGGVGRRRAVAGRRWVGRFFHL